MTGFMLAVVRDEKLIQNWIARGMTCQRQQGHLLKH